MTNAYQELEAIFARLSHLEHLAAMAQWDEAVMMPSGGADARTAALSTLNAIMHDSLTHKKNSDLITAAKQQSLTPWQTLNLQWMEKLYHNAVCLPVKLVQAITESRMQTEQAWRHYRTENDWHSFAPLLDKNFQLVKEAAELRAEKSNRACYDVLLDDFAPGITQNKIDPIFKVLKENLPGLIQAIIAHQKPTKFIAKPGPFPLESQKKLALKLMQTLGFDFTHGRLDVSHHPFCGGVPTDVRITTRYNEADFIHAAMGVCHETGHALYEQQLPKAWLHQPIGRIHCMACHESQSLLMEMEICHSSPFIQFFAPLVENYFGKHPAFKPDNLYASFTRVKPSLIRVEADEVTYPLHIILRYEIEKSLFAGKIHIKDLPDVWDTGMRQLFNLDTRNNYRDGVMQDVHWPAGLYGYFPAYTLGRLAASQFFAAIAKDQPDIHEHIRRGEFTPLRTWLAQHIHQHASSVNFEQLLLKATGSELNPKFFLNHIQQRYL